VVSVTNPYGRILGFLDRNRYYSSIAALPHRLHGVVLDEAYEQRPLLLYLNENQLLGNGFT
jgi:hypothetical protein